MKGCLPREAAAEEIHQDVAKRLHVVAARELGAVVCIDRCVPRCAHKVLLACAVTVHSHQGWRMNRRRRRRQTRRGRRDTEKETKDEDEE